MKFLLKVLPLVLLTVLSSCSSTSDPSTPDGPTTLTVERITDLPMVGGDVTSVDVTPDGTILAVIDGKLASVPAGGGAVTVYPAAETFQTAVVGGSGEVYALAYDALWLASSIGSAPVKTTAFQRNGQTESVKILVGPNGQPYLRIYQYPSTMLTYTSTDRGATWTRLTIPGNGGLAFGPNNTMYASSSAAFHASTDNGTTWTQHPAVISGYGGDVVARSNGDVLYYVPGAGGLSVSSNQGASFTALSAFNTAPFHLKIVEGGDGNLYSLVLTSSGGIGDRASQLMRSTDGGATWRHVLFVQGHDVDANGATMAVGFGATGCGGVGISRNNGGQWVTSGLRQPTQVQNIGLNKDGRLVMMADKGLFTRTTSGWTTMGSMVTFTSFTATPTGAMYVGGTRTSYASADGGTTWTAVAMPDIPVVGNGPVQTPVVLGLQNGDCLISLTHFRTDLTKHTNGILSRITPSGQLTQLVGSTNYVWMVQDAQGTIYARTDNFVSQRRSSNNGVSFTEVTQPAPGFVFTNDNRAINYNGSNGFTISNVGFTSTQTLTINGLTTMPWMVTHGVVDKKNKLYLLSSDQGVFVSTSGL